MPAARPTSVPAVVKTASPPPVPAAESKAKVISDAGPKLVRERDNEDLRLDMGLRPPLPGIGNPGLRVELVSDTPRLSPMVLIIFVGVIVVSMGLVGWLALSGRLTQWVELWL